MCLVQFQVWRIWQYRQIKIPALRKPMFLSIEEHKINPVNNLYEVLEGKKIIKKKESKREGWGAV